MKSFFTSVARNYSDEAISSGKIYARSSVFRIICVIRTKLHTSLSNDFKKDRDVVKKACKIQ